ncbi:secreted effector protein PipB2 [Jannaschia seosinensis]|uniref:Secreted effector protein PipB2 n=1 Tax=Jannaschia seosinensis TaxID=313367 RepID=A0A0M7BEB6_9RHOB|nr:pentapeptide repeat-containing protein [Jannaschia seosinensis]CUH39705.1 secreted effector protein PipB2 [Jannaschia seosinensis]
MSDLFDQSDAPQDSPAPEKLEVADRFLDGSTFTRVSLRDAVVEDSILTAARIEDVNAEGIAFSDCRLARATFRDVNLTGAALRDVNLTGVEIVDSEIDGMTIDGIPVADLLARWRDG